MPSYFPEWDEAGVRQYHDDPVVVHACGPRIVENFLDMAHFPFVHAHLLGQVPHTEVREYRVETDAASGELLASGCRFWQPKSSAAASDGSEVVYRYRVMQPLSAMLYKSAYGRGDGALDAIALFVQPLSEERVVAHVLLAYLDDVTSTAVLIAFQQTIFGQDKPILENHVPRRLPLDGRSETATRADLSSVLYRRWLAARGLRYGAQPRAAT